jgi:hypothetical protein
MINNKKKITLTIQTFFLHFSNGFDDFLGKTIIVFNKTGAGPGITLYSYKDLARMCTSAKIHSNFIEQRKPNIKIRIKLKIKDFCHWPLLVSSYLKNCKSYSNSVKKKQKQT